MSPLSLLPKVEPGLKGHIRNLRGENQEWAPIPDFVGEASDQGWIRTDCGTIWRPESFRFTNSGYPVVRLPCRKTGEVSNVGVGRCVLGAFVGWRDGRKYWAVPLDTFKPNTRLANLQWMTPCERARYEYAFARGRRAQWHEGGPTPPDLAQALATIRRYGGMAPHRMADLLGVELSVMNAMLDAADPIRPLSLGIV